MLKAIPPMNEMFKMAGMDLPEFLGKDAQKDPETEAATAEPKTEAPAEEVKA